MPRVRRRKPARKPMSFDTAAIARAIRPAPFDPLAHARLSRDCWLARAREAKASEDGRWGMRTLAECVFSARAWNRTMMAYQLGS